MQRKPTLNAAALGVRALLALAACLTLASGAAAEERPPNFVILFADDLGYGDLGCYGAGGDPTPHLDRLAREGLRFTDFYVAQAVCGASRAALLTGCYPNRIGMLGAPDHQARHGIHADETLLPELLRPRGYATACLGKWHLGHHPPFLPLAHGFDAYLGLPYSNDMWPFHPTSPGAYPPLPLLEGDRVLDPEVTAEEQRGLTNLYTERAVQFIEQAAERPFFLYLAYAMPHVPLFASERFADRSGRGLYAHVLAEIDDSVSRILAAIRARGLDERTLVLFASDNGPWLSYGDHAGSAGPLREGKGTAWEGGVRAPCLVRWPGRIPAGTVCRELAATIDVLPTFAALAGADLPKHTLDGRDLGPLLTGAPEAQSPHEAYYYYWGRELHAVRSGRWKLHFPHDYRTLAGEPGRGGKPGPYKNLRCGRELYDLAEDVGEQRDVAAEHPEIVARLEALAEQARADLGDALTARRGANLRPAGRLP